MQAMAKHGIPLNASLEKGKSTKLVEEDRTLL